MQYDDCVDITEEMTASEIEILIEYCEKKLKVQDEQKAR